MYNVLVIGGGGREHAIALSLSRSPMVKKIFAAPGNPGIASVAECVPIGETCFDDLISFAKTNDVDLTIVGPELPLVMGIVDVFQSAGLTIFGPSRSAARIESSKVFANDLMRRYSIPTAGYAVFDDYDSALVYVRSHSLPVVIKYEGLAAGKGVVVAESYSQAEDALKDMLLSRRFGSERVVIEDFLVGREFSFMCFVDGDRVYPLQLAQDYKRAYDGDCGPNTGGMGAYSPVPFISEVEYEWAYKHIMCATAEALVKEGATFSGLLYGGLIKTDDGIKVVEFNARFGDPESEVVLSRIESDLFNMFFSVANHLLPDPLVWSDKCACGVVLTSKGYPGRYDNDFIISGLDDVDAMVYHMGTAFHDGCYFSHGGRVMMVSVLSDGFKDGFCSVYNEISKIKCDNLRCRKDIGWQVVNYKNKG